MEGEAQSENRETGDGETGAQRRRERLRVGALAALLLAATLLAYAPALSAGFVWDDDDYVTNNPLIAAPDGLRRIWFSADAPSQYFPLVYSSFRLEHSLWGMNPRGYHAVNVVLHAANALLVFLVLRRMRAPGAAFAAAIFALHPVHVESVAWITERKNVLSLFFFLLSLFAWLRFSEHGQPSKRAWYGAGLAAHALALFAKTTACTLPAAQVAVLWARDDRVTWRRVMQTLPFLALGIAMAGVTVWWERNHQGTVGERFSLEPLEAVLVSTRAIWFYLGKLAWPSPLIFSYPKFAVDVTDPLQYGWMLAGGIVLFLLWRERARTGPGPLAAALFFVGTLSPMLGFVPLFTFFYTYVADHYQYAASLGPIALFAAVATRASERFPSFRGVSVSLAGMLLLLLGALSFQQARSYENREILWRDVIAKHPTSWMAHTNLGRDLLRQKRAGEATDAYERAVSLSPAAAVPRPLRGLGLALRESGRHPEALAAFQRAVAASPGFLAAHYDLAAQHVRLGDTKEARAALFVLLEQWPEERRARLKLARLENRAGRADAAVDAYRALLARNPRDRTGALELAALLAQCVNGELRDAAETERLTSAAIQRLPDEPRAWGLLARARAAQGNFDEASELLRTAIKLQDSATALDPQGSRLRKRPLESLPRDLQAYERHQPPCPPAGS